MVRILTLRLLIGWWACPLLAVICWALGYLLTGDVRKTNDSVRQVCRDVWFGITD